MTGLRTGGDNNVEITLGRYVQGELAVKCGRRKEVLETCRDLLISMPVTTQDQRFGPKGDSKSEVILPWGMMSRKISPYRSVSILSHAGLSQMTIDASSKS